MRDLGGDHLAGRCAAALAGRDLHVDEQPAIERHDEPAARVVDVVAADDALRSALENADDAPFGAVGVAPVLDAHDDAIAVHGLVQVVAGDEDARRAAVARGFRFDEREAAGVGRDAADDQVHPVGQAEPLPANLDERAAGHERAQPALERGPLLARNTQASAASSLAVAG